jgi:hypothetical protein
MATTSISPVDYGFINLISGVYGSGEGLILASVTSSQASNENRAFWYYDTRDATTGIPSGAIIDSVVWNSYLYSVSYGVIDEYNRSFLLYGSNTGAAGGTLDAGDWSSVATNLLYGASSLTTGTISIDVTNTYGTTFYGINRSGYTNYCWITSIFEGGSPGGWQLNSSWSPGTLDITWHSPSSLRLLASLGVGT